MAPVVQRSPSLLASAKVASPQILSARGIAHVAARIALLERCVRTRSAHRHALAVASDAGALDRRDQNVERREQVAQVQIEPEDLGAAQPHRVGRLHGAGEAAGRTQGRDQLGVRRLAVRDRAAVHKAHVAAGDAAARLVGFARGPGAARHHVGAEDVPGDERIELLLRGERLSGELRAVAALRAHVLHPCVPRVEADAAQRTGDLAVLLRGIGNLQRSQQVIGLHEAEQQAQASGLRRIGGLEQAGVAARRISAPYTLRMRSATARRLVPALTVPV